ncbi:MAG: hypothetical protein JWQ71_352 [Pedosphaera sp.]|nr:hypothetical protein [Pedosphaera sp.]
MPLYAGKGAVLSWVSFTNAPGVGTNLSASLVWIKLANPTNLYYPGGFTNLVDLVGSGYVAPTTGHRILNLTNTTLILAGGNLATPIVSAITLASNNTVTVAGPNTNNLKLTFTSSSGAIAGSFIDPVSGRTNSFKGAARQNGNYGAGEFLGTNQSGYFLLGQ